MTFINLDICQANCPAIYIDDQAYWKLYPPKCPVTSITSPIKNNPEYFLDIIVFEDNSSVSTPPKVTSAVLYPLFLKAKLSNY